MSLRFVPRGEKRPLRAIQTAEKWTRGKATIEEVRAAAAYAASAASAAYAADAAASYGSAKWRRERAKALRAMVVRSKCKRPELPA